MMIGRRDSIGIHFLSMVLLLCCAGKIGAGARRRRGVVDTLLEQHKKRTEGLIRRIRFSVLRWRMGEGGGSLKRERSLLRQHKKKKEV